MDAVLDEGPFFHGTKAELRAGDLLTAGFRSNYRPEITMNHIYFTALRDGAGLAAELAAGEGTPRVYLVEPTGEFEDDPNVTDKKFPAIRPAPTAAASQSGSSQKSTTGRGCLPRHSSRGTTDWPRFERTSAARSSTEHRLTDNGPAYTLNRNSTTSPSAIT